MNNMPRRINQRKREKKNLNACYIIPPLVIRVATRCDNNRMAWRCHDNACTSVDDGKSRIRVVSSRQDSLCRFETRAARRWQPFSLFLPPLIPSWGEGRGSQRGGMVGDRAIYRLPLIEDDDLTRSYNRLGIAINDLFCSVGTVYVTSTTARLKRGEGVGKSILCENRHVPHRAPWLFPWRVASLAKVIRTIVVFSISFLFLIALLEYRKGKRKRERDVCCKGNVYVDVDGNEYLGLISFSSDRRGGLNFIREYMIEESGSMRGVNRMLCRWKCRCGEVWKFLLEMRVIKMRIGRRNGKM